MVGPDINDKGTVFSARDQKTGEYVAVKKLKIHEPDFGFPVTSLREINILNHLNKLFPHPNIVKLREVAVGAKAESIFLIFEFCEMDLGHLADTMHLERDYFTECEIKCIVLQILSALNHLHSNSIIHRDLKLSNLLIDNKGIIKLADFGLSRVKGILLMILQRTVIQNTHVELSLCIIEPLRFYWTWTTITKATCGP